MPSKDAEISNALVPQDIFALSENELILGSGKVNIYEVLEDQNVEWKDIVLKAMALADAILYIPGKEEGILWEMEKILEHGYLFKTILIMPTSRIRSNKSREDLVAYWNQTRDLIKNKFDIDLGGFKDEGGFRRLSKDEPLIPFVTSKNQLEWKETLKDQVDRIKYRKGGN